MIVFDFEVDESALDTAAVVRLICCHLHGVRSGDSEGGSGAGQRKKGADFELCRLTGGEQQHGANDEKGKCFGHCRVLNHKESEFLCDARRLSAVSASKRHL